MPEAEKKSETQKKSRAGKPKTRSGCRTCKLRRVKCDETRPFCIRCTKSGWECEGFFLPNPSHAPTKRPVPLAPKVVPIPFKIPGKVLLIEPSTFPMTENLDEHRYFNIFQTQTAPELTGFFETNIWNRLILQLCHDELYAWHAVVAIGALHRTLELSNDRNQDPQSVKTHHTFALKQYGTALKLMRQATQKESNEDRLRDTLISCVLTTCFESYIGNQEDALKQAQAGIDILLNWPVDCPLEEDDVSNARKLVSRSRFLSDDILGFFTRLDFQVMQFKNTTKNRTLMPNYAHIPEKFESVTEARFYWDMIVRRVQHWHISLHSAATEQYSTLDFGENNTSENSNKPEFAGTFEKEFEAYESVTAQWYERFEPLFQESRKEPGSKNYLGANMMMVRYLPSKFAISKLAPSCDTYADEYLEDYKETVRLSREVLENYSVLSPGKAFFEMDVNLILSLFIVATRCRVPSIRREAIELMVKYPRRECFWDSMMAAKVATWIMEQEEEGMVDGYVPETARLRIVKNDFVLKERKAVIQCSKLDEGSHERILLPEVTLTW